MTDDHALYTAWREGDRSAGATLVDRHYDSVSRFFMTKVGPGAADDLIQRTFLVCAEPSSPFRGEGAFKAYLFGIARRVLLEHFRGKSRGNVDHDFGVSSCFELAPGPSTVADRRAEQRVLVEALRRIPVEMQIILELYYWEDLSVDELARILDIPSGTVKSRLYRGRQLLREAMDKLPASPRVRESVNELIDQWAKDIRGDVPQI